MEDRTWLIGAWFSARTWKSTLLLPIPDEVFLDCGRFVAGGSSSVIEVDDESSASRGFEGYFTKGCGEGREELLSEL